MKKKIFYWIKRQNPDLLRKTQTAKQLSPKILLIITVSLLVTMAPTPTPVSAQAIIIRSDFTFTSDLHVPLQVERNDLVIDGNGFTLQGPGSGTGIEIGSGNNVTIKNLRVEGWYYGIDIISSYLTVFNNDIVNNEVGISIKSLFNTVYYNNFIGNTFHAEDDAPEYNYWYHPEWSQGNYWDNYPGEDLDGDGIGDTNTPWFRDHFPFVIESGWHILDTDSDGLTNWEEVNTYGTNPSLGDTDGDGLSDGDEILIHDTNPLVGDTDGDGLSDGDEILVYHTNPLVVDADADYDGDGLMNVEEVDTYHTNPTQWDTDGDGLSDGFEVLSSDPRRPLIPEISPLYLQLSGEFDYTEDEPNPVQIKAMVTGYTQMLISGADVRLTIYYPDGSLAFSAPMVENVDMPGVYLWESPTTLEASELPTGIYLVNATASFGDSPPAIALMEFRIVPRSPCTCPTPPPAAAALFPDVLRMLPLAVLAGALVVLRRRRKRRPTK